MDCPSDGTPSPAKACAPSCGFGFFTGQSKMVLLFWVGDILGKVMMTMVTGMIIRHPIEGPKVEAINGSFGGLSWQMLSDYPCSFPVIQ
ncbi:hypothetical protein Q3G72_017131 [Acer saccharum]|nr:hypothetical protein Q3G72_017131 [Acer saccharum]